MSCSEVSFQLRMFSTSAAKRYFVMREMLTLDVEIITVADGRFEEHTDAVGQLVGQLLLLEVLVDVEHLVGVCSDSKGSFEVGEGM